MGVFRSGRWAYTRSTAVVSLTARPYVCAARSTVVKLQALQTRIESLDEMLSRQAAVVDWVVPERTSPIDLCRYNKVIALPPVTGRTL